VAWITVALVDVCAGDPISLVAVHAGAFVAVHCVHAERLGVARVGGAAHYLGARFSIAAVSRVTRAFVGSHTVVTLGIDIAQTVEALIDVITDLSIADVAGVTTAPVAACVVLTERVATTRVVIAFINVRTGTAIASIPRFTGTSVCSFFVGADTTDVARVVLAFINVFTSIHHSSAAARESRGALTAVGSLVVCTGGVSVARLLRHIAFIYVLAILSITSVPVGTCTLVRSLIVLTERLGVAGVDRFAFIDIATDELATKEAVSLITRLALTHIRSNSVLASSRGHTGVRQTLVDVLTGLSIALVPGPASALVGAGSVSAISLVVAGITIAVINVRTLPAIASIACITFTCVTSYVVGALRICMAWADRPQTLVLI
jgi:hypothetical protein